MKDAGPAWMSIGHGSGQNRAVDAAKNALASPLLDVSISGAKGVLFNVIGGDSLALFEVNEAAEVIKQAVDPDANIIFGVVHDSRMDKDVKITLVATGFQESSLSGNAIRPEEMAEYLKDLKNEEQLDVPAFLRRPLYTQRRVPAPQQTAKPQANKAPTYSWGR
jgi:cell division protein FtsZ